MLALAMRREHTSGRSSNYEPGNPLTGFEPLQQTSFVHQVNESRIRGDGQINDDGELQEYVDIAQVQQLLQQQTQHQQHHHQQQTTTACLWGGVYPPPPPPPTIGYPHHHHHHHHHHTPSHQSDNLDNELEGTKNLGCETTHLVKHKQILRSDQ
ncbi:hypothetical protein PV326_002854 [Microctonus aethiopoides]|nr:hypothetical protein PV326_002854 [Microctonus aethiopoides]